MNTSTTDAYSRDNISSDITTAKKSDYKEQKQKNYKYDQNPRYTEETSSIPVKKSLFFSKIFLLLVFNIRQSIKFKYLNKNILAFQYN